MFLHVTTHIEGRKYDDLLDTVGGRGFPSFFMLDQDGSVLAQHQGARSIEAFQETAGSAAEFLDLRTKAEAGDPAAKIDYTLKRAEMGQFTREELEKELKSLGKLSAEQEGKLRGVLANLMVDEIRKTALGERFAKMQAEGLVPAGEQQRTPFFIEILNYAEHKKDAALFESALEELRTMHGDNPQAARFFDQQEARLEKLKQ